MLKDRIKIKFIAGKGGRGGVSFDEMRKPSGGDGGKGGDIYLEGTNNLYDLSVFQGKLKFKAENGVDGSKAKKTGRAGNDLVIKVPITTIVFDEEDKQILKINQTGQRELLVSGGRGGLGNFYFRRGQMMTRDTFTFGKEGQQISAILELRLAADVIFIGLPNAGKSSMLNALTNAKAKVAPYPFTTLEPHLGVSGNLIFMDLPGFIEGTSEGKGIGKEFTKHMKNAKLICHFLSLESSSLQTDYDIIRKEIENLDPYLASLPELLLFTKSDLFSEEQINTKLEEFNLKGKNYELISSFDYDKLQILLQKLEKLVDKAKS